MPNPETITIQEFCLRAGVNRSTGYAEAKTGSIAGIPVIKIGTRMVLPRRAVDALFGAAGE